ncbi:MAG TPA: alpha/beta fold hydrolase [Solirubrobacteraceae bacterium]|nr:alpha/beta fold hydrolase [Solirubrobacteraceae bacterium]
MPEDIARVGDVELAYETFGDPAHPALLLVMGLGTQMLGWRAELCAEIAARGFHVVRYDNRDVGRSTKFSSHRPPSAAQLLRRDRAAAAYTLADMADDGAGLLDCLGIRAAHVVGASMGGMIAQTLAFRHPDRVLSLVSIMSNTGARWSGQPALSTYGVLLKRAPADREGYIEHQMRVIEKIGSPAFPRDEDDIRRTAAMSFERGHDPAGAGRQLAAVIASGDRTTELARIRVPTLVIHGTNDRLVAPSGGRATAKAIPGARLLMIPGMGHDLPRGAWPQIVDAIAENAARAGAPAAA